MQRIKNIEKNGWKIVAEQPLGIRFALLAYDSRDAAFYITEGKPDSPNVDETINAQAPK